jgi:hypothetical protein
LPDFSWGKIPKRGKFYQMTINIHNGYKTYKTFVKYSKWPQLISTLFIPRPYKIYPSR